MTLSASSTSTGGRISCPLWQRQHSVEWEPLNINYGVANTKEHATFLHFIPMADISNQLQT